MIWFGDNIISGGTPSASSQWDGNHGPEKALDGNISTQWAGDGSGFDYWWKYDFGVGIAPIVRGYSITARNDAFWDEVPDDWKFQGSNNDSDWTDLDIQSGVVWTQGETKEFLSFSEGENITGYRYYRYLISDNQGTGTNTAFSETSMYAAWEETATLEDSWSIATNPESYSFNETVTLDDTWSVGIFVSADYISDIIFTNPIIFVTDTDPAQIVKVDVTDPDNLTMETAFLLGTKNAASVSYNSTTGFLYVSCADGIIVKVDFTDLSIQTIFDVSDTDDFQTVTTFNEESITFGSTDNSLGELYMLDERETTILDTNFQYLQTNETQITTDFEWIEALLLDTNFQFLQTNNTQINTDFKWLTDTITDIDPIGRNDFVVKINGTTLQGDDLIPDSIVIYHTIGEESTATFRLARYHDNMNTTLNGSSIPITSQNSVQIIINGKSEFIGNVANINCVFQVNDEYVEVTAQGTQQVDSRHNVIMSLPSNSQQLGLYDVLVQNPQIKNSIIDPDDENPEYFLGIKVSLGERIVQNISRTSYFGPITPLAEDVTDGSFIPKQNWSYFWFATFRNFLSGKKGGTVTLKEDLSKEFGGVTIDYDLPAPHIEMSWNRFFNDSRLFDDTLVDTSEDAALKYLGTSIGSLTADAWEITGLSYKLQRIFDDIETDLGEYTVGEAPFQDVSTKNGEFRPADKWTDKPDGLYREKASGYNYIGKVGLVNGSYETIKKGYAQTVADLEFEKLTNINGTILPKTSASINLTIDCYYYYALKLLTRINIDNTNQSGIFRNNNGFPVSIKSITISSASMGVSLSTDNLKSIVELEEIDDQYPEEDSNEYILEAEYVNNFAKFDPPTGTTIE